MKSNETKWYYTRVWYLLKRYNLRLWMTSCEHNLDSEAYLWVPAPVRFSIFQDSRLRRKSTTGRSGREQISMTRRITILWRSLHPKALLCGAMSPWLDSFDDTHTHTHRLTLHTRYTCHQKFLSPLISHAHLQDATGNGKQWEGNLFLISCTLWSGKWPSFRETNGPNQHAPMSAYV